MVSEIIPNSAGRGWSENAERCPGAWGTGAAVQARGHGADGQAALTSTARQTIAGVQMDLGLVKTEATSLRPIGMLDAWTRPFHCPSELSQPSNGSWPSSTHAPLAFRNHLVAARNLGTYWAQTAARSRL
jgi:hypothetical protein